MTSFTNIPKYKFQFLPVILNTSSRTQFPKAFHKLLQKLSSPNISINSFSYARMLLNKLALAVKVSTIVDGEQMSKVTMFKQGIDGR